MKKMLLKFADATLRKDELKSIKGGYGDGTCGSCWNTKTNTIDACGNPPWSTSVCMCPSYLSNNACG